MYIILISIILILIIIFTYSALKLGKEYDEYMFKK